MPKVFIFSPARITRRKISRVEHITSCRQPLAIRSKSTLLLQRQRQRLRRSRHERAMVALPHPSALVVDSVSRHSVAPSDIPLTKDSALAECANVIHGNHDANPYRWSPTVLRKRKESPAIVSFQLPSRTTLPQIKEQPNTLQLSPGQDKASSTSSKETISCPQPRFRSESAALREWIACVIFGFVLRHDQSRPPVSFEAVATVAANIKRLFVIYPLHDEVVLLALWYASHMMPDGLLVQFELYQPDGIVLATRLFVLSYTLAIKWLSDEAYLLQHWVPHYQKEFSISSAKALDKAALELFDYSLYISPSQWTAWLYKLDEWPSISIFAEDRVHFVAQTRIRKLLFKSETSSSSSRSRSISISGTAAWKVHKILLDNLAISIPFPDPAPWNPAGDPIIHTTGRRQPSTQAPSPWSFGNHCYPPPQPQPPFVVYNHKGEVRAELLGPVW